jgi:hypothetical protein
MASEKFSHPEIGNRLTATQLCPIIVGPPTKANKKKMYRILHQWDVPFVKIGAERYYRPEAVEAAMRNLEQTLRPVASARQRHKPASPSGKRRGRPPKHLQQAAAG